MKKQYFYVIRLDDEGYLLTNMMTMQKTYYIRDAWKFTEEEIKILLDTNYGHHLKKIYPNLKILEVECIFREY